MRHHEELINLYNNGNPFKGLQSYEENDYGIFYGRKEETEKLVALIHNNILTIVYGKSGIGKTSLLNAGVFPRLERDGFPPIRFRLNYSKNAPSLKVQVRSVLINVLQKLDIELKSQIEDNPNSIKEHETLWEYFKRVSHVKGKKEVTPVLVFDQFEELFTLGKHFNEEGRTELIDELHWLIENQFPGPLDEKVLSSEIKNKRHIFSTSIPNVRVVFSLREDFLPDLDELKSEISKIGLSQFRVNHLNGLQAREIISLPGGFKEKENVDKILKCFLHKNQSIKRNPLEGMEIEPVFLSLLCHQLYERKRNSNTVLGELSQLGYERIIEEYYDSVLNGFPDGVEKFIEQKLLTQGGYRTPFYLEPNRKFKKQIAQLIDRRILRKFSDGNREYVEIIHDVLAPIIKKRRDERIAVLQKRRFKRKLKWYFYRVIIRVFSVAFVLLSIITWYAIEQKNIAGHQYKNAQINRLTAESLLEYSKDNTRAIRMVEKAFELAQPNPPARTYQALSSIGYSSLDEPFYTATLHHDNIIYSAVFSEKGDMILTGSEDGTARLWTDKGKLLQVFKCDNRVQSALFSPDGQRVLTSAWNIASLWSIDGKLLKKLKTDYVLSAISFSPDGKQILGGLRNGVLKLWDGEGNFLRDLKLHNAPISTIEFSHDSSKILTATWDREIKLWNPNLSPLEDWTWTKQSQINSAMFFDKGEGILAALKGDSVRLFDLHGQQKHFDLTTENNVQRLVYSPSGDRVLTIGKNGSAELYDREGNLLKNLKNLHRARIRDAVFSPDGCKILTAADNGTARVWQLWIPIVVNLKNKTKENVLCATFSDDGKSLWTVSRKGMICNWSLDGKKQNDIKISGFDEDSTSEIAKIVLSLDKKKILVYNAKRAVLVDLDIYSTKLLENQKKLEMAVFTPDGKAFVSVQKDKSAIVYDLSDKILSTLKGESMSPVATLAVSPDGKWVATGSVDGIIRVWGLQNGRMSYSLEHKEKKVNNLAFSHDSSKIVSISNYRIVTVWDVNSKKAIWEKKFRGAVVETLFSQDDLNLLTVINNAAELWNLATGKSIPIVASYPGHFLSATLSKDSRSVILNSGRAVTLWNSPEGNKFYLVAVLDKHSAQINSIDFSTDDSRVITGADDGTAKIWMTPDAIFQWLKNADIQRLSNEDMNGLGIQVR